MGMNLMELWDVLGENMRAINSKGTEFSKRDIYATAQHTAVMAKEMIDTANTILKASADISNNRCNGTVAQMLLDPVGGKELLDKGKIQIEG